MNQLDIFAPQPFDAVESLPAVWTCHAVPASTGRRCGFVNTSATVDRSMGRTLVVCAGCGCTKFASDRRAA